MSRRPGTTSQLPAFHSDKMRNFLNRMGGVTTQPEATTLVPQISTSTEGIQTQPLVETNPPSPPPPPPPPLSPEPPPPPPPDSSYGQAQSQFLHPRAQSFILLNHPQPLLTGHPPQPSQYGHHNQPPPNFCPPAPLPPGFYPPAPPDFVPPPLPYNLHQTGSFVGPSQYEIQLQMPHMQNRPHLLSNRSDHRGRREGGGGRSYNTNNSRHNARPSYDSNARRFSNSSAAPLNTVAQTVGSRTPPWRPGGQPALINTAVATDTPRRNDRDGSTQTQSQPPELQVENTSPQQQVSRTTQTEEGFIPADTERPIPGRALFADLFNLLEHPAAAKPERAPTPVQIPIQNSPSGADSAPVHTPTQTSTSTGTVQADSSPLQLPRFAPQTIVKILSDFRKNQAAAFEGM